MEPRTQLNGIRWNEHVAGARRRTNPANSGDTPQKSHTTINMCGCFIFCINKLIIGLVSIEIMQKIWLYRETAELAHGATERSIKTKR